MNKLRSKYLNDLVSLKENGETILSSSARVMI